jgi:hypothetical protein
MAFPLQREPRDQPLAWSRIAIQGRVMLSRFDGPMSLTVVKKA